MHENLTFLFIGVALSHLGKLPFMLASNVRVTIIYKNLTKFRQHFALVYIGTGGGFPNFVRIVSGKQDIGISSEGRGGNSSGHSGDGGETLNYLKAAGDGN